MAFQKVQRPNTPTDLGCNLHEILDSIFGRQTWNSASKGIRCDHSRGITVCSSDLSPSTTPTTIIFHRSVNLGMLGSTIPNLSKLPQHSDEIQRKFGDDSIWIHEVIR